jgi:hypothetical protein
MNEDQAMARTITPRRDRFPVLNRLLALLTASKAGALLDVSRMSAYRYAAAGDLPTRRFGGRMYVVPARLLAMLDDAIEAGAD